MQGFSAFSCEAEHGSSSKGESSRPPEYFASKYQFKHLSFQEAFFAEALTSTSEVGAPGSAVFAHMSPLRADLIVAAQKVWEHGALKALNTRWFLNTFRICGRSLAKSVSAHLGGNVTDLRLTNQQVNAFIALKWEPIRSLRHLARLTLRCSSTSTNADGDANTSDSELAIGLEPLSALLASSAELSRLTAIDFGVPATISVVEAATIARASHGRKGLRLYAPVHYAQFRGLTNADAVLIAATLRNVSPGAEPFDDLVVRAHVTEKGHGIYIGVS